MACWYLLVFNIMHNNIPVVCQVLFSQARWVKKSNVFKDIFTCKTVVSFDNNFEDHAPAIVSG